MCFDIPRFLYKYRPFNEHTKNLLLKGELYFAPFCKLNDPNEALFVYNEGFHISVFPNELDEYEGVRIIESLPDDRLVLDADKLTAAKHLKKRLTERRGVLSLTETNNNLFMFDFYAAGHKGICIEFDWQKFGLMDARSKKKLLPEKIEYCSVPPHINTAQPEEIFQIFIRKWEGYNYEKEWRFFNKPGPSQHENVRSAITSIVFGCALSIEDKKIIKDCIKDLPKVALYQARLRSQEYALDIIKADDVNKQDMLDLLNTPIGAINE